MPAVTGPTGAPQQLGTANSNYGAYSGYGVMMGGYGGTSGY